jgi:hypothetical protein
MLRRLLLPVLVLLVTCLPLAWAQVYDATTGKQEVLGSFSGTSASNLTQVNTVTVATGAGAVNTGTQRVAIGGSTTSACPTVLNIDQTSGTDLHTFTAKGHICSIMLVSATAQSITLAEGTGSVCGSTTAYLIGGSGGTLSLAANGGFSMVAGLPWLDMGTAADHLCLLQSSTGNVSGVITVSDN